MKTDKLLLMKEKIFRLDFLKENNLIKGFRVYERGFYKVFRVEKSSENPESYGIFLGTYSEKMDLMGSGETLQKQVQGDEFFAIIKASSLAHDYIRDMGKLFGPVYLEDLTLPIFNQEEVKNDKRNIRKTLERY